MKKVLIAAFALVLTLCGNRLAKLPKKPIQVETMPAYAEEVIYEKSDSEEIEVIKQEEKESVKDDENAQTDEGKSEVIEESEVKTSAQEVEEEKAESDAVSSVSQNGLDDENVSQESLIDLPENQENSPADVIVDERVDLLDENELINLTLNTDSTEQLNEVEVNNGSENLAEENLRTGVSVVEYSSEEIKLCVIGNAKTMINPDIGEVTAVIDTFDQDMTKAKDLAQEKFDNVVKILQENGVQKEQIVLNFFNERPCGRRTETTGYHGHLSFTFKLDDLSNFDGLIEQIEEAGVSKVCSICYGVSDIDEQYSQVLTSALENAKSKASKLLGEDFQLVGVCEERVYQSNSLYKDYVEGNLTYTGQIEICASVVATFI